MISRVKRMFLVLCIGGGAGFALLLLAYMIPTDSMIKNAKASVDIFKVEGVQPQVVHGYKATSLDNYTDTWMLRNAFYNGEEPVWQKSLNIYYYGYTDGRTNNVCESTIAWLEGEEGYERMSYARYWHGYLVILKPLLYFFDYGDIRGILKAVELMMLVYVCVLLEKRNKARYIPAFLAAMLCAEFHVIGMSMQYSWVFLIAMTYSIIILKGYPDIMKKPGADLLFLMIGMTTSYFDFLTYPLFTLGIPLLFLVICMGGSEQENMLPVMAIKSAVCWAIGYIGMWVEKWILCTLLTGENLIADGIHAILNRSGRDVMGVRKGYLETLHDNVWVFGKYPYALVCLAAVILLFIMGKKENKNAFSKRTFYTYAGIAVLPFCWYAISINHSYIHCFMTYRILCVTVFAILCAVSEAVVLILQLPSVVRSIRRNE